MKALVTCADAFIGSRSTEARVREVHDARAFLTYKLADIRGWLMRCARDVKSHFEALAVDIRHPQGVAELLSTGG
jgi:dTDP-glucose 4,6-dehydratase